MNDLKSEMIEQDIWASYVKYLRNICFFIEIKIILIKNLRYLCEESDSGW